MWVSVDGVKVEEKDRQYEGSLPLVKEAIKDIFAGDAYIYAGKDDAEVPRDSFVLISRDRWIKPGSICVTIEVIYYGEAGGGVIFTGCLDNCGHLEPADDNSVKMYADTLATVGYAPFIPVENFTYSTIAYNGSTPVSDLSPEVVLNGVAEMAADITERTEGRYVLGVNNGLIQATSYDRDWSMSITMYSIEDGRVLQNIFIQPE